MSHLILPSTRIRPSKRLDFFDRIFLCGAASTDLTHGLFCQRAECRSHLLTDLHWQGIRNGESAHLQFLDKSLDVAHTNLCPDKHAFARCVLPAGI